MLLTRNGRFNNDSFYTEAKFDQNNAYAASLLTAVQNALYQNFSITKQLLDQNYQEFKKTNTVPAELVEVAQKSPQTPVGQNPQAAAAKPKRAEKGQPIIRSDFKGPDFIYWNDIVTKVSKNPRYCSVTTDRRAGEFKFTESSNPTMLVFYDFEKTQSETKMVIVPAPSLFNEDGSLKAPIPSPVLKVFATHGPGVPDWSSKDYKQFKVDGVKPITVVYDSQGRKIGGNLRHIGEGPTGTIEISQIQSNNAQAGQASGTPDVDVQPKTDTQQAQAKIDDEKAKLESLINDVIPVDQIQTLTANGKLMATDRRFDGTRLLYFNESGGEFIAIPYNKTDYFVFARLDKFTGEDPFYEYGEEIISLFFDIKKGSRGHIIGEKPCIVRPAVGSHEVPLVNSKGQQLYSIVKKGSIVQGSH